jgi:hypothetical protein
MNQVNAITLRPAGGSQKVAYTGTAGTITNPLPQGCQSVACYCSTAAYIKVAWHATGAAATTADIPVPANVLVVIPVPQRSPNDAVGADKVFVSAIQDGSGGNLYVQPTAD